MRQRDTRSALTFTAAAALVAALGVLVVYGGHIFVGFYYDDYHFVRPWSTLELRRVWFGSWDPLGIEAVFYRPLTAWWLASRFWLFGVNAAAMHLVSVAGHAVCATLVAWFVRRERVSTTVALLGAWLYAIHPVFPYAQVSWLTNQMHLAESILVLVALLYWQTVRDRRLVWWLPLAGLAAALFLVKEDGIMLLPALLAVAVLRYRPAWTWTWLVHRGLPVTAAAAVVVAALIEFRYVRLGRLGGYGWPTFELAHANFWKGLTTAIFLWPTRRPWQAVASLIAIAAIIAGLGIGRWRRGRRILFVAGSGVALALSMNVPSILLERSYPLLTWQALASGVAIGLIAVGSGAALWLADRRAITLIGMGLAIALCFNLPFVLVSKREQYHLLALGSVLAYAGAADALLGGTRVWARSVLVLLILLTAPAALLARSQATDFRPCESVVLDFDRVARDLWMIPDEIKAWLDLKANDCQAGRPVGRLTDLPVIAWNVHGEERVEDGTSFRWTSDHAVLLSNRTAKSMTLAIRRPGASAQPSHVTVAGGLKIATVMLDSEDWKFVTVRFRPGLLGWLRAGSRVDLDVDSWFVPALLDPHNTDLRRFGVQMRVVDVR